MNMTTYTFDQLRSAVQECTSYDLIHVFDSEDEHDEYVLIDAYGDQDGDAFTDLDDVYDYITDNEQVNAYLKEMN
jgi:hypothetical protein